MRGGGVWADTATGLQGIENWLNAHPALLSLMKNTGNLAAGATWLKNFTPAGIVIGLVTNYGYEQVLQLMEGRKDVAREALSSYFKAHDKDITQEQASYLANFSMEVLQAAGQVAVHQVAAKRFNAVKKGRKVKGSGEKVAKVEGGVAKTLQQVLPSRDTFLKSAKATWKDSSQGTLSVAGRALQKHSGRTGSSFSNIKFSGKTANQNAMRVIEEILNSNNQVVEQGLRGGYELYDATTRRGFSISRNGLFNGFRNYKGK